MSRPTSSVRYGTCAVHHTLPSHPVAICGAKRSPFSVAALPSHGSVDPLELVGFASDSPPDLPPPPPPLPGLCDDGPTARWMMLSGRRRLSTSTDNSSSTFGVGRSCRTTVSGPSSTLSCYSQRTTGTGPAAAIRRSPGMSQPSSDAGGLLSRTDSAPLPLSDYDDDDPATPVDQRLLQPPSVIPLAPSAAATTPTARHERQNGVDDCRTPLKNCPHSLTSTTSVAVCRL